MGMEYGTVIMLLAYHLDHNHSSIKIRCRVYACSIELDKSHAMLHNKTLSHIALR